MAPLLAVRRTGLRCRSVGGCALRCSTLLRRKPAGVPGRRRPHHLRRHRHRQEGQHRHRPDQGRFRGHRGRQDADGRLLRAGRRRRRAADAPRADARRQRQHAGRHEARAGRGDQVPQHAAGGRGHHARRLRHPSAHHALSAARLRAARRADSPAQGRRLDRALRRARHLSRRRRLAGRPQGAGDVHRRRRLALARCRSRRR